MKRLYKAVSVLMSLITVFSVFAIVPLEVSAAEGIEYIYRWWDSGAQEVKSETRICTDYTELNDRSSSYLGSSSSSVSWYVVKKDFWRPYYATHMQVTGTVNLIICDGVTFNAEAGVIVPENATLNIFGQSNDSGKFKVDLNVDKHREFTDRALIGGDSSANGNPNSGDINIYGGNLDLKTHGFSTAAMIGGAKGGSLNRFAMYGGTLTAVHGGNGAVI